MSKRKKKTFLAAELLAVPVQDELVVYYKNGKELGILQGGKKVKCYLKNKLNATVQIK